MLFKFKKDEKDHLKKLLSMMDCKSMPSYVCMLPTTGEQDKSTFEDKDGIIKFKIGVLRMKTEDNRLREFPTYPTSVGVVSCDHTAKDYSLKKGDIVRFNPTSTYEYFYKGEQYLLTTSVSVLERIGNIFDSE